MFIGRNIKNNGVSPVFVGVIAGIYSRQIVHLERTKVGFLYLISVIVTL